MHSVAHHICVFFLWKPKVHCRGKIMQVRTALRGLGQRTAIRSQGGGRTKGAQVCEGSVNQCLMDEQPG